MRNAIIHTHILADHVIVMSVFFFIGELDQLFIYCSVIDKGFAFAGVCFIFSCFYLVNKCRVLLLDNFPD